MEDETLNIDDIGEKVKQKDLSDIVEVKPYWTGDEEHH